MIVTDFFQALRTGKELANAETWKDAQQFANTLTAFLVALVGIATAFGYPIPLTNDQIASLANGFLVALGLFNWVAAAVSSKRVGLLPAPRRAAGGAADGTGDGSVERRPGAQRDDPGHDADLPVLTEMDKRG